MILTRNSLFFILLSVLLFSCEDEGLSIKSMTVLKDLRANPRDFKETKIFAHRGHWNTSDSYENTLTSIIKAAEIRVHGVELDVRISADQVLYLHHDAIVKQTGLDIGEMLSEEIDKVILPNGDNIPRLDDALILLKEFPELLINFEFKTDVPLSNVYILVKKLNDALMAYEMSNRAFISSFNLTLLSWSKDYNPHVKTQLIVPSNYDIEKIVDANVDMINYYLSLLRDNPSLIPIANSFGIEVCTGSGTLAGVIEVIDNNWNIKYINTDEPQLVMKAYYNDW